MTATANDVALHILETKGEMGTMKLQKLVFYSQAYSMGWFNQPIFQEDTEAWIHGPVVRDLWELHRKKFTFNAEALRAKSPKADPNNLTARDKLVVESVLHGVGALSGLDLRDRTHVEDPWKKAFDINESQHNRVISLDSMHEYYSKHS